LFPITLIFFNFCTEAEYGEKLSLAKFFGPTPSSFCNMASQKWAFLWFRGYRGFIFSDQIKKQMLAKNIFINTG